MSGDEYGMVINQYCKMILSLVVDHGYCVDCKGNSLFYQALIRVFHAVFKNALPQSFYHNNSSTFGRASQVLFFLSCRVARQEKQNFDPFLSLYARKLIFSRRFLIFLRGLSALRVKRVFQKTHSRNSKHSSTYSRLNLYEYPRV